MKNQLAALVIAVATACAVAPAPVVAAPVSAASDRMFNLADSAHFLLSAHPDWDSPDTEKSFTAITSYLLTSPDVTNLPLVQRQAIVVAYAAKPLLWLKALDGQQKNLTSAEKNDLVNAGVRQAYQSLPINERAALKKYVSVDLAELRLKKLGVRFSDDLRTYAKRAAADAARKKAEQQKKEQEEREKQALEEKNSLSGRFQSLSTDDNAPLIGIAVIVAAILGALAASAPQLLPHHLA